MTTTKGKTRRAAGEYLPSLTIRVDDDVYLRLQALRTDTDHSFNDTLRRLLGLTR